MKIWFNGDLNGLVQGINIVSSELGFQLEENGIIVKVEKTLGNIEVGFDGSTGVIKYKEKIHFFRALGIFVEQYNENNGSFYAQEEPQFTMNGPMFDVSRNAVLKVESIKTFLKKMALMGLNMLMLYMEDTYTIESRPYFGYMRGRYSFEEMKECDDYADILGIEIIPCIQTLAHLGTALRWDNMKEVRDTSDILLAGNAQTYQLIEDMIRCASTPFRSKRIHVGMDEAWNLGLGKYLDINGYSNRFDIMKSHLEKVLAITDKFGLKPMMWSDMYFRIGSKTRDYYDEEAIIPTNVIDQFPDGIQLVYWDYYDGNESFYKDYINKHRRFGIDPIFAGGVWTWTGICTNYEKTFLTTNVALNTCKKEGIKEVFVTIWGDNGNENNYFSTLLGLQLYAEHGYSKELDMNKLKKRFKTCAGGEVDAFMDLTLLDTPQGSGYGSNQRAKQKHPNNPSKFLLWQDILLGLFDRHVQGINISDYYTDLEKRMKNHLDYNEKWESVFAIAHKLCSVLSIKSDIGLIIKKNYDERNLSNLTKLIKETLPELKIRIIELRDVHREQWFKTYKPHGWEILDIRYGGLMARVDTAIKRLSDFIEGDIMCIEELEEVRLYFDCREEERETDLCECNRYNEIVSASVL